MPLYVVERNLSDMTMERLDRVRGKAYAICRCLDPHGKQVRYLRSVFVPGQSRWPCLFNASDLQAVREVNEIGRLPYLRILIVLDLNAAYPDPGSI